MVVALLLQGVVLGVSIAAPVGPIGVLCIQRTIDLGWRYGIVSGLGAATADACYGAVAALGLTIITHTLASQHVWIQLIGSVFLLYLGSRTLMHSQPRVIVVRSTVPKENRLIGIYTLTLLLTLTNVTTILSFLAIFASVRLLGSQSLSSLWIIIGVFSGSMLWWLILTTSVYHLRTIFNAQLRLWINRISGGIIVAFGMITLLRIVVK